MDRKQRKLNRVNRERAINEALKSRLIGAVQAVADGTSFNSPRSIERDFEDTYKRVEVPQEKQLWQRAKDAVLNEFRKNLQAVRAKNASSITSGYAVMVKASKIWS